MEQARAVNEVLSKLRPAPASPPAGSKPKYSGPSLADLEEQRDLSGDERFEFITLTPEETDAALTEARKAKYFVLRNAAYAADLQQQPEKEELTAEQLFERLTSSQTRTGKPFDLTSPTYAAVAWQLCYYFTGDGRFNGSLQKGLALIGDPGTGKTEFMRFFQGNQVRSFRVKSMTEIVSDYAERGEEAVRIYHTNAAGAVNRYGHRAYGYCFDDVGTDRDPKHYGNEKSLFSDIFFARCNNVPLGSTHFTSNNHISDNLNGLPSLMELYGSRILDRMAEQFNIISFEGIESFRK